MPTIDEELHKFEDAKYISEIDMCKAYYQVPLEKASRPYTAFPTRHGLMQFKKLPFGLSTACSTYVRLMRKVFRGVDRVSCYFDNVYVYSKTWKEHVESLREVFQRLEKFGLTAGPSKCFFGFSKIKYLGLELGNNSISPLQIKIESIANMPLPRTKKQLRSFMGTISFYRKFIPNLAELSNPLMKFLKKNSPDKLQWDKTEEDCFLSLKSKLTTEPILKLPDPNKKFVVRTDASNFAIGAVLLQYHDDLPQPVMYASRTLSKCEVNYATVEKECLAVVWAVSKFRQYLFGREFVLETDHQPLSYLRTMKPNNGRLMRWALSLQSYQYKIDYIKGRDNIGADLLSRVC